MCHVSVCDDAPHHLHPTLKILDPPMPVAQLSCSILLPHEAGSLARLQLQGCTWGTHSPSPRNEAGMAPNEAFSVLAV